MNSAKLAAIILFCVMGGACATKQIWKVEGMLTVLQLTILLEAIWFSTMVVVPIASWALGLSPTLNKVASNLKDEYFPRSPTTH